VNYCWPKGGSREIIPTSEESEIGLIPLVISESDTDPSSEIHSEHWLPSHFMVVPKLHLTSKMLQIAP
jgi:hypothetical protein